MSKQKVVYYLDCWGVGGIERFVINASQQIVNEGYETSVFASYCSDSLLMTNLETLGIPITIALTGRKAGYNVVARTLLTLKPWFVFLRKEKPDIVHINIMNGVGFLFACIARLCQIDARVVHSHNSSVGASFQWLKSLISAFFSKLFGRFATNRLACSESAGSFLFGSAPFRIINNGINVDDFIFDPTGRSNLRTAFNIGEDVLVIGNPSRLAPAKNPLFSLDVLQKCLVTSKVVLVLCCVGEMIEDVKSEIEKRGLSNSVILLPPQSDMRAFYSLLDVLLFPSLYEGLPFVVIEAQCNGLPIVASDAVSCSAFFSKNCHTLPLEAGPASWAKIVCQVGAASSPTLRYLGSKSLSNSDYNSLLLGKRLAEIYQAALR